MKTISFVSQKGGTGKTTLALNIATEAMRAGLSVAIIDLDPQPSAMAWSDLRANKLDPPVLDAKASRLAAAVQAADVQGLDLLIIDTGGRTDEGAHAAAKASDLVVIPIQPSAIDLKSMEATRELIERAGQPASLVVLTRVKPFGTRHEETTSWLTANGFTVSPVTIGDRVPFQDAYAAGQTVAEFEAGGKAAQEIRDFYMQICDHVDIASNGEKQHEAPKSLRTG
jgi:chromosome partitioning protein